MNKEYVPGTVISLYENDDEKYCVVKLIKIDMDNYLILQILDGEEKEIKNIDVDKLYMIKLGKTNEEFEFVKDDSIIEEILIKAVNEEMNR